MPEATLRKRPAYALGLVLLLAGCSSNDAWMPLHVGKTWRYFLRQTAQNIDVRVVDRIRVGDAQGWLLESSAGNSKMAWVNRELKVAQLSAMRFEPPLTLLKPQTPTASWSYQGVVISRAKRARVKATLNQRPHTLKLAGLDRDTLRVSLKMKAYGASIEMTAWFQRGTGILQQEQRNNGALVSSVSLIGGS